MSTVCPLRHLPTVPTGQSTSVNSPWLLFLSLEQFSVRSFSVMICQSMGTQIPKPLLHKKNTDAIRRRVMCTGVSVAYKGQTKKLQSTV